MKKANWPFSPGANSGSGTRLIYLLGTILMAFAATGLVMREKRRA